MIFCKFYHLKRIKLSQNNINNQLLNPFWEQCLLLQSVRQRYFYLRFHPSPSGNPIYVCGSYSCKVLSMKKIPRSCRVFAAEAKFNALSLNGVDYQSKIVNPMTSKIDEKPNYRMAALELVTDCDINSSIFSLYFIIQQALYIRGSSREPNKVLNQQYEIGYGCGNWLQNPSRWFVSWFKARFLSRVTVKLL